VQPVGKVGVQPGRRGRPGGRAQRRERSASSMPPGWRSGPPRLGERCPRIAMRRRCS